MRSQAVDRSPPADLRASPPKPAPGLSNAPMRHFFDLNWRGFEVGVSARNLPAARQRDDVASKSSSVERQHQVDHRQAGTDDQSVATGFDKFIDSGARLFTPWVSNEAASDIPESAKAFRLLVANRQRQRLCVDGRAVPQPDSPSVLLPLRPRG